MQLGGKLPIFPEKATSSILRLKRMQIQQVQVGKHIGNYAQTIFRQNRYAMERAV
jgi:hypothetical protein